MKHIKVFDSYALDIQEKLKSEFKKLINFKFLNKLEDIFTEYEDMDSSIQIKYSVVISDNLKMYYMSIYYHNNDTFNDGYSKTLTEKELEVAKNGGLYYRFWCAGGKGQFRNYITADSVGVKNAVVDRLKLHFDFEEMKSYDNADGMISYIKLL